jgi:aminoglycoside phosphotransferase (APT) family kinase protein
VRNDEVTAELVKELVAAQFPQWAGLRVQRVELDGWDNSTFRLGASMSVRLPTADRYVPQIDKERRWLPVLGPQVPVPIPVPLAWGEPSPAFPRPWSVYAWLDGQVLTVDRVPDVKSLATELAGFLAALYACDPVGPAPGPHSFGRGGPVSVWDEQTRADLETVGDAIDARAALEVWGAALDARPEAPPTWVHGDVTGSNLLVRDGHLAGVLDFGCCAVGDPACDLTMAWTFFEGDGRAVFKQQLRVEDSAWARGRGWALWKALRLLAAEHRNLAGGQPSATRLGWRLSPRDVIELVIDDHRRDG